MKKLPHSSDCSGECVKQPETSRRSEVAEESHAQDQRLDLPIHIDKGLDPVCKLWDPSFRIDPLEIARKLSVVNRALRVTTKLFAERMKEVSEAAECAKLAFIKLTSLEEWKRLSAQFKGKRNCQ